MKKSEDQGGYLKNKEEGMSEIKLDVLDNQVSSMKWLRDECRKCS